MSEHQDLILFFVNLAFNLLMLGCLIGGGIILSFRLIKTAHPRLRYIVTVTAFLAAVFLPLAVTYYGSVDLAGFIKASEGDGANYSDEAFSAPVIAPEIVSSSLKPEPGKTSSELVNYSAAVVADSFIGAVLFGLWILGAIGFASRDIFALWQMKKARKSWREASHQERRGLALPDNLAFYFGAESPATIGLWRPVIVLPETFPDDLSLASKRFIVQHELSHARWRDPSVNFCLRFFRALFWISPALWLLERIAVREREAAADRFAVARCAGNQAEFEETALNYAATLVSVAKHFNSSARSGSVYTNTTNLYNGCQLESRVRRLLAYSSKTTNLRLFGAAMIFAGSLAGLFFIPVAFQTSSTDEQKYQAGIDDQSREELTENRLSDDLPVVEDPQNGPPQLIRIGQGEQTKAVVSVRNGKTSAESSTPVKEHANIPRVIMVRQDRAVNSGGAVETSETLTRKLSEEGAKARGLDKRLGELNENLQKTDKAKKELGGSLNRERQKAASQIDLMKRQVEPPTVENKLKN